MPIPGIRNNGRNTYDTQVAKFLYGGRLDNLLKGHNKIVNGMEDPSFFAFCFGISPATTGLFAIPVSGQNPGEYDMNIDQTYSVMEYLRNSISPNTGDLTESQRKSSGGNSFVFTNIDDLGINSSTESTGNPAPKYQTFPQEYSDMGKFTEGFREITINHPYMLQTVEGLQDAYKKHYNMHKDSYLGGNDTKLKITCLESLDLRMSALFDSYYRAVYNHKYRRMNIPRNLLSFDCWVLVHDMRNLAKDKNGGFSGYVTSGVDDRIVRNLSTILFKFNNCTFDIDEIGTMFETVNNAESNQTKFAFSIIYNDVEVYVNSLADMLESGSSDSKADSSDTYRTYYDKTDIIPLNEAKTGNDIANSVKLNELDNAYDMTNLGGLLKNIGSKIFNYATQGSTMGNIYDESWAGILSSMMSSISNVGVSSVIRNAIGTGVTALKNKVKGEADKIMGFAQEERTFKDPYTNTVYGGRDNQNGQHESMSADNIYDGHVPNPETLVPENVYGNPPGYHEQMIQENIFQNTPSSHGQMVQENAYGNVNLTHTNDNDDPVYTAPNPPAQFVPEMADMTSNAHHGTLQSGEFAFTDPQPNSPYNGEYADMSAEPHEQMESDNVYPDSLPEIHYDNLGSAYTITATSVTYIPTNVYDRIIESTKHEIGIDKIFIPPTKPASFETEYAFEPIRETKEHSLEEANAYMEDAEKKIRREIMSIGNAYSE